MKTFKIIDLFIQGILILAAIILGITNFRKAGDFIINFYFGVGASQIISMSIHYFFIQPTVFHYARKLYGKLVMITLIPGFFLLVPMLFGVMLFTGFLILYLYALLIFSPLLAIFYFVICWKEYRLIVKRELIHLK